MMSLKFSLIFVELYCLFVVTKCVENSQFDISDVFSDSSSYFHTTRGLQPEPSESLEDIEVSIEEDIPVKPVYTLAREFVADFEILLHKVIETFVNIGRKKEGQKTLLHIYQELFTIASNSVSVETLKYLMQQILKVMQDPNASKIVLEFFEMIQDLMQYDLVDWHFVVPFIYDLTRHPMPEQVLGKLKTEVEYILLSEDRKKSFAAAFSLLEDSLSSASTETLRVVPITAVEETTQIPIKQVTQIPVKQVEQVSQIPVKQIKSTQVEQVAQVPVNKVKSNQVPVEQVTTVPVKQVTQVPVKQVDQVSQIPVNKVKSNQVPVEQVTTVPVKQVTQVPVKQVEQVTKIPVTQVESSQVVEEEVTPVPVETVQPAASESAASKLLRRVKSLPASFKKPTVEQV